MPSTVANSVYRLSVVMIVKNEAHNLAISLPALAGLADEIIILDSGSTDNSQPIGKVLANSAGLPKAMPQVIGFWRWMPMKKSPLD